MSVGGKRERKSKPTANQSAGRSTCFARRTSYCGSVSLDVVGGRPSAGVFSQAVVAEICGIQWPGTGGQFVYSDPDSSPNVSTDTFTPTTNQQLTPMYEAIFRPAPQDAIAARPSLECLRG
jgi:hypothetical protein